MNTLGALYPQWTCYGWNGFRDQYDRNTCSNRRAEQDRKGRGNHDLNFWTLISARCVKIKN